MRLSATDIITSEFEKVAKFRIGEKSTNESVKTPNYDKVLKKQGVKKPGKTPLEEAMKNGKRFARKDKVKKFVGSNKKSLAAGAGAMALAGIGAGGYKAYKGREKTAFDVVNEVFEKEAGVLAAAAKIGAKGIAGVKGLAKATKGLGASTKQFANGATTYINAGKLGNDKGQQVGKRVMGIGAKKIGKGLVLPGVGAAGIGAAGAGINSLRNNNEVTASALVNSEFEKVAKISTSIKSNAKELAGATKAGAKGLVKATKEIKANAGRFSEGNKIRKGAAKLESAYGREMGAGIGANLMKDSAKKIGKGLVLPGTGVAGVAGVGIGANKLRKKTKKEE